MTETRKLPAEFEARVERELGTMRAERLLNALREGGQARAAVRLNHGKGAEAGSGVCAEAVARSGGDGHYVSGERPVFAFDPAWHAGLYYVQDASSMALSAVAGELAEASGGGALRYLDACAAPGGKTIAAVEALPKGSVIVANEYDRRRTGILVENIEKWGAPGVVVSNGDTAAFRELPEVFDIVAVDAPCSGEGMMRKEPEAIAQWSAALVSECARLQREILGNVWEALRPGGYLIYSTCTFSREENEDNVAWAENELGAIPTPLRTIEETEGPVSLEPNTYRFMPGFIDGEGLFIAALRKPEEPTSGKRARTDKRKNPRKGSRNERQAKPDPQITELCRRALGPDYQVAPMPDGSFTAVPPELRDIIPALTEHLHLRLCGTALGSMKGRDISPAHALALSRELRPEAFARVELEEAAALDYLHGESLTLPEGTPHGIVVLTAAGGAPIGFAKNLGKRANNLFPQTLRLKTHPGADHKQANIAFKTKETKQRTDK